MLLQALDKLQHEWEGAELGVLEYRDTGTYIIKVWQTAVLKVCAVHGLPAQRFGSSVCQ
jgi:hypothetical protein